jgi:hypothetical protein
MAPAASSRRLSGLCSQLAVRASPTAAAAAVTNDAREGPDSLFTKCARPFIYFVFHHVRLFGWIPASMVSAVMAPRKTALAAAIYAAVHRTAWWQDAVHRTMSVGASRRSSIISPHKDLYDPEKRYLLSIHPHGILLDGIHSSVARHGFGPDGGYFNGKPGMHCVPSNCLPPCLRLHALSPL